MKSAEIDKETKWKATNAMKMLAEYYINGKFVTKNINKAFYWYNCCDTSNCDCDDYYEFAKYYSSFDDTDMSIVLDFYQKASNLGSKEAFIILLNCGSELNGKY